MCASGVFRPPSTVSAPRRPRRAVTRPTDLATVREVAALREAIAGWRRAGRPIGLVPTMGALHEGHLSLVRHSLAHTERTCVTLFVNPRQFGPREDFAVYPRDEAADRRALERLGVHLLFAPGGAEMYPQGHATSVTVAGLGDRLEGERRPGFFAGVATVVAKLLLQAFAGRGVLRREGLPAVSRYRTDGEGPRHPGGRGGTADGKRGQRTRAFVTQRVSDAGAARRRAGPFSHPRGPGRARPAAGAEIAALERRARRALRRIGFDRVDYITVRDAETLEAMARVDRPARALAAAWLGETRLIDNHAGRRAEVGGGALVDKI